MADLHVVTTAALSSALRDGLRVLLNEAFDGDFDDDDWVHALGGVHAWVAEGGRLLSHGAVVPRRIEYDGHILNTGFVEAVATLASHRRRGYGSQVMSVLNRVVRERHAIGALSTGTSAFYATLGWERWSGPTHVDGPAGRRRTPDDDGGVMILRTARTPSGLDLAGPIVCDLRAGDVW